LAKKKRSPKKIKEQEAGIGIAEEIPFHQK
jgi:hypothetical protein